MEVLINISSVKGYLAIVFRLTNVYMCVSTVILLLGVYPIDLLYTQKLSK